MLKSTTVFEAFYVVQKHVLKYGLHSLPPRHGDTYTRQAPFNRIRQVGWALVKDSGVLP